MVGRIGALDSFCESIASREQLLELAKELANEVSELQGKLAIAEKRLEAVARVSADAAKAVVEIATGT
jgi:hypothetical protein